MPVPSASLPRSLPAQQASPLGLLLEVLLRGAEYMPQLVLGNGLPLAFVLSL